MKHRKNKWMNAVVLGLCFFGLSSHTHEEGMFPLNLVNYTQLQEAGLKLKQSEIFEPGSVSLSDALVKLGGCTGSFISKEGLVITNHHCVYGGVAELSTTEKNHLDNGFVANSKNEELPLAGMPCRITVDYEDVSDEVLVGTDKVENAIEKADKIATNIKAIRLKEYAKLENELGKNHGYEIAISEMFVGKSYMLFKYILLEDVRLVVAPPRSIGQFGGDTDNWEWPRHGGDFSIVRVYVGKDGKPAKYAADNVPYVPKKHLKIDASGANENDFIFIMGYPGRTYRNQSSYYMQYQEQVQLPMIQNWYKWKIDNVKNTYANDKAKLLSYAGELQGLENTEKNYRGKIQGLRRTKLVQARLDEDKAMLEKMPESEPVLTQLSNLWEKESKIGEKRFLLNFLFSDIQAMEGAMQALVWKRMGKKNDSDSAFKNYFNNYTIEDEKVDKMRLHELLNKLSKKNTKVATWYLTNKGKINSDYFYKEDNVRKYGQSGKIKKAKSTLMQLCELIGDEWINLNELSKQNTAEINALLPEYTGYREKFKAKGFIPDANSTLRLTYGYIKGYMPNDGVYNSPFTTIDGVFEKENSKPDYMLPKVVSDNLRVENPHPYFLDKKSKKVAVNLLYNLDTTGGNSGSPILNAKGELIGVNFDRSFTATINDYAWNNSYSRSLGVDIRYCVYIMTYVSKAPTILNEIGIKL